MNKGAGGRTAGSCIVGYRYINAKRTLSQKIKLLDISN